MTTKTKGKTATLDTRELREALQQVNCVKARKDLPVLSTTKVEFANNKATLTTADLERSIKVEIKCVNSEDFSVLLPRKTTEKFLAGGNGKVSITQGNSQKTATLTRDDMGEFSIPTSLVSDFPLMPPVPDNLQWHSIDGRWLCSMLRIVSTASCANEISRLILTGIACNDGRIAAADGFRLHTLFDSRLDFGLGDKQAIIPLETIILINKLFRQAETLEIAFGYKEEKTLSGNTVYPNYVYFKSGNTLMFSQLILGNYPSYEQLIPDKYNCKASFSAPLLLQRLGMMNEDTLLGGIVRYAFETTEQGEQVCSLSASVEDEGEYHLTCPVKFEGEEATIALAYKYIASALKPFSMCTLEITAPSSPCKFTGDIEGLIITIMPMFVQ